MSKKNLKCDLKYCQDCGVRLRQGNCREEDHYVVLTRTCPKCGKSVHLVEITKADYNQSVQTLNKIIDLIQSGG